MGGHKIQCWLCQDTGFAHYDESVRLNDTTTWTYDMVARCTCTYGQARPGADPGSGHIPSIADFFSIEQIEMLREAARQEACRRYPSVAARYGGVA